MGAEMFYYYLRGVHFQSHLHIGLKMKPNPVCSKVCVPDILRLVACPGAPWFTAGPAGYKSSTPGSETTLEDRTFHIVMAVLYY
jgi:hypothetical protein